MQSRRSTGWSRSRRRAGLLAAVCAVAITAGSGPAGAYRLGGKAWSRDVITYRVTVARDRAPMAEAARQWNISGVRLRFREVRSGRGDVVVRNLRCRPRRPASAPWVAPPLASPAVSRATSTFTRVARSLG